MPSSAVRTFFDPDDFAASLAETQVELTVTGRGRYAAKLTRVLLHPLRIHRVSKNLPGICHATMLHGQSVIQFLTAPGPSLYTAGLEMLPTNIVRHSPFDEYHQRSSGSTSVGTVALPVEDLAEIWGTLAGGDLKPPLDTTLITPPPAAMRKLQRLHAAVSDLAETVPEIIAHPDAARGLEQALIEAVVGCFADCTEHRKSFAHVQHALVMRRFTRVLEENPERSLFIPDVCAAIGVSERTLRICCQEHLGTPPKRYLVLRRMSLAQRALRAAEPGATSVTAIGTRYGFWELGRFAVEYQARFGESPSATLRRQPG